MFHSSLASFARLRRKIAPIYVGDAQTLIPQDLEPWSALQGRRHYFENESAVRNGEPSQDVVKEIANSFSYTRDNVLTTRKVRFVKTAAYIAVSAVLGWLAFTFWTLSDAYQIEQIRNEIPVLAEMDIDRPPDRKVALRFMGIASLFEEPSVIRRPIDTISDQKKKVLFLCDLTNDFRDKEAKEQALAVAELAFVRAGRGRDGLAIARELGNSTLRLPALAIAAEQLANELKDSEKDEAGAAFAGFLAQAGVFDRARRVAEKIASEDSQS
jgi:hypothetical protein